MLEEISKKHNLIFDNFDLGSQFTLLITIQGDRAMITNSSETVWGANIPKDLVGNAIAETIMLKGLETIKIKWGSFYEKQELIALDKAFELTDMDFDFDTDFLKLWTLSRLACNMDLKGKIVEISYFAESDTLDYKVFTEEEYKKDFEKVASYYEKN